MTRHARNLVVVAQSLRDHRIKLQAFVRARVPPADVDDILQVAALHAVEKAELLEDPNKALAWLYRVHRNVITDAARARASRTRLVELIEAPVEGASVEGNETCACSVKLVQSLSPTYSSILAMVDLGESTIAQAAATLDISVNSATVRLHRARASLRQRMQEHCGVSNVHDCVDCRCVNDGCCA